MDWRKFRTYLKEQKGVTQAFMFIGYIAENEDLYKQMYDAGFNVILKPTVGMFDDAEEKKDKETKGNVDTDLVLETMKQWKKYDKAIIVSGDGDFYGLVEHLKQHGKLGNIMVPNWKYSSLLKEFDEYIVRLDELKPELAYHKKPPRSKKSRQQAKKPADKANKSQSKPKSGSHRPRKPRNTK